MWTFQWPISIHPDNFNWMNPSHLIDKYIHISWLGGGIGCLLCTANTATPPYCRLYGVAHISLQILPSSNKWENRPSFTFLSVPQHFPPQRTWPRNFFRPLLFISHSRALVPALLVRFETLQLHQTGNFTVIANPLLLGPRLLKVNFNRNKVNKPQR